MCVLVYGVTVLVTVDIYIKKEGRTIKTSESLKAQSPRCVSVCRLGTLNVTPG